MIKIPCTLEEYVLESGYAVDELLCYRGSDGKFLPDPLDFYGCQEHEIWVNEVFYRDGIERLTLGPEPWD